MRRFSLPTPTANRELSPERTRPSQEEQEDCELVLECLREIWPYRGGFSGMAIRDVVYRVDPNAAEDASADATRVSILSPGKRTQVQVMVNQFTQTHRDLGRSSRSPAGLGWDRTLDEILDTSRLRVASNDGERAPYRGGGSADAVP